MQKGEKMNKKLILLLLMIFIVGCSDPKIDASSDESMKASIEKVRQSLPQDKKDKFDEALKVLAFSTIDLKGLFAEGASGVGSTKGKMKEALNGKTGTEVIEEADRIKRERKEKEKSQALSKIQELEAKQKKAKKAKNDLAKFKVIRSRFYKQKQKYMGEKPIIELTVRNGTSHPISRAYFKGTLASPNRSVPWLVETFNYKISGGLEPGEEVEWSLAPNMFGDWGKVDAPADAILTVEVEQIDGSDGKPLFSSRSFSERDAKRLKKLKDEYGQ